jgi:hypothetical protein
MRFLRLSEPPPRPGCMYASRLDHDELSRFDGPTCRRTQFGIYNFRCAGAGGSTFGQWNRISRKIRRNVPLVFKQLRPT